MARAPESPKERVDPKTIDLVCAKGEDPRNERTKGAVATIYDKNSGQSLYHLSPRDARPAGFDAALKSFGLDVKNPDQQGLFRHSQDRDSFYRDPYGLRDGVETIRANFNKDGKLEGCHIQGSEPIDVPAVDGPPQKPAEPAAPKRVSALDFDPTA